MERKKMEATIVYQGLELGADTKTQAYYWVEKDRSIYFGKKLLGWENIGSVLKGTATPNDNGTHGFGSMKYVRSTEEDDSWYEQIALWSVNHRAELETKKLKAEAAKEHSESVENYIQKITDNTWKMNRRQKYAFAMYVFERILTS